MRLSASAGCCALLCLQSLAHAQPSGERPPIIDMHLHALPLTGWWSPPPIPGCQGVAHFPGRDPRDSTSALATCRFATSPGAKSDEDLMRRTLAIMKRYNVIGVTSGPIELVRRWYSAAPDRIIPSAIDVSPDSIRAWAATGTIRALGELGFQYAGLAPSDSIPEAYFALAEELDLPIGVHMGLGPPGAAVYGSPKYRASLGNPLLLEDVLRRHPRLRLYVMHAGWPMLDEMIALLYTYPQVYVDIGVLWWLPRREFELYLQRLVNAGFSKRVMFGSDNMIWPEGLEAAIRAVDAVGFLTPVQKRDIFYNNAARFLRLHEHSTTTNASPRPNEEL